MIHVKAEYTKLLTEVLGVHCKITDRELVGVVGTPLPLKGQ